MLLPDEIRAIRNLLRENNRWCDERDYDDSYGQSHLLKSNRKMISKLTTLLKEDNEPEPHRDREPQTQRFRVQA